MGKFDEYLDRAKDLAAEAGDAAKTVADDVVSRAKDLTEEGSAARELAKSAKGQAVSIAEGAKEKVRGMMQDARAVSVIAQGISELEALPEVEGSILYTMELETIINSLKSLQLTIGDNRLDDRSVAEEIRKTMDKVRPDGLQPVPEASLPESPMQQVPVPGEPVSEEQAINNAKTIAYNSCAGALETLNLQ